MTAEAAVSKYNGVQITLHWLIALLIFGLYVVGLSVDQFEKPLRPLVINLHAIFGLSLLILVVARIAWRTTHPAPAYPEIMGPLFRKAAAAGHGLLYLLTLLVPILGLRAFLFRGRPFDFGLFQIPSPFEGDHDLAEQAADLHGLFAHLLIALVAGHVIAALYHQFVLRDNLLARMRPR
jgi:cytochrome b561